MIQYCTDTLGNVLYHGDSLAAELPEREVDTDELNEHFLFHGTTADVLNKICKGGFDPQRGGEEAVGKMFGTATYLAANASKSDIYT